jgi:hypothetical protein
VYPTNPDGNSFTTAKASSSSGCMCEQSNGRFNAGDLFPYLLLLFGWFAMLKHISLKKKGM